MATGKSNAVIAEEIGITLDGVKWHVSELLGEAGFASRRELAEWWRREASPRVAPVFLPRRILAHPVAGAVARIAVVFAVAAAIAAGVIVLARRSGTVSVTVPAAAREEKLAYVQDGDIWVKALPDGVATQLTRHTDEQHTYAAPGWSPSGQWLTFLVGKQPGVMRADGSDMRLFDVTAPLAWSPSGEWIAFTADDLSLQVERADGSDRHTAANRADTYAWSPTDDRLVWSWSGPLTIVAADGSGAHSQPWVGPFGTWNSIDIKWSSDGHSLVYVLQEGVPPRVTSLAIWHVSDSLTDAAVVYDAGSPPRDGLDLLAWTRLDALLFYRRPSFTADVADGVTVEELRVGSGPQPIVHQFAPHALQMLLGLWSLAPSERLAAFTSGGGRETWTNKRIAIASPLNATLVDVTPPDVAAIAPAWSPDGLRIAYVAAPDTGTSVSGGDAAKAAMAKRKIWVMDAAGSNQRQLTSDPAYRDERPRWSADGSRIYFMRLDQQDRWSLWSMSADGSDARRLIDNLSPNIMGSTAPVWFGYYGLVSWSGVLDFWQTPANSPEVDTLSMASLGLTLQYPAAWSTGAAQEFSSAAAGPVISCSRCTVLGPPSPQHTYGVEIFTEDLDPGCAVSCYVGNNAIGIGETPLDPAAQTDVRVAGIDAKRMEIQRQAPLGIAAETGDYTPYREIWTFVPWYGKALFFVAFYRDGDAAAEGETRAAYEALLASVERIPPPEAAGQYMPVTFSAGQTISVWGYADALDTRPCMDALADMMPAAHDVPDGDVMTCTVDDRAVQSLRFVKDDNGVLHLSAVEVSLAATSPPPASQEEVSCDEIRSLLLPGDGDPSTAATRVACLLSPPARGSVGASQAEFWSYVAPRSSPTAAFALPGCWELPRYVTGNPGEATAAVRCSLD